MPILCLCVKCYQPPTLSVQVLPLSRVQYSHSLSIKVSNVIITFFGRVVTLFDVLVKVANRLRAADAALEDQLRGEYVLGLCHFGRGHVLVIRHHVKSQLVPARKVLFANGALPFAGTWLSVGRKNEFISERFITAIRQVALVVNGWLALYAE